MKKIPWALLLGLPTLAFGAPKNVTILTAPSEGWSPAARNLMEKAASIVFDRINEHDVAQCAYRNAFREDVPRIRRKWGSEITVLNKNPEVTLKVLKKKLDRTILGLARLGQAQRDPGYFRVHGLEVIVNETTLNQFVAKYPPSNADQDLSIWVNTIAHEIAHNFGYRHGTSGVWIKDYPGFFPTELGFCVMSNGKNGSDLGNYELRRKFKEAR